MRDSRTNGKEHTEQVSLPTSKARLEHVNHDFTEPKKVEEVLIKTEQQNAAILETMSEHVVYRDTEMKVLWANRAAAESVGLSPEELQGRYCYEIWHKRSKPCVVCPAKQVLKSGKQEQMEIVTPDGRAWWIRAYPIRDGNAEIVAIANVTLETTERNKAEEAMRKTEKEKEAILESMSEFVVYQDTEHRIIWLNRAARELSGLAAEKLAGRHCYQVWQGRSKPCSGCPVVRARKTGQPQTGEVVTRDGKVWSIRADPVKDPQGNVIRVVEIVLDITERKKAEKKLHEHQARLKLLASQLTLAEERERHRIASELHDQITQWLIISKIKLEALRHGVSPKEPVEVLDEVCNWLAQTIDQTRSLTFDLSFPILYPFGLEAAVAEWLAGEIRDKHGLATQFLNDEQPKPLDEDVSVLLFRNVRELLTNVVKHAQASKVKVSIRKVGSKIKVRIEDDGVGFDPAQVTAKAVKTGAFGLFSIRERLEHIGGSFEIESAPGRGCRVVVVAPMREGEVDHGSK